MDWVQLKTFCGSSVGQSGAERSLGYSQNPHCIFAINLFQNLVRKGERVRWPVILREMRRIKMFIVRFQNAKARAVHFWVRRVVCPVKNPVLIFGEESADRSRNR